MTYREPGTSRSAYRRRRTELKRALRKYAERFDMTSYLHYDGMKKPDSLPKFEECGTACCMAGMADVLWKRNYGPNAYMHIMCGFGGVEPSPIYTERWPADLEREYLDAEHRGDHAAMVEAACRVIDRTPYREEAWK